MAAQPRAERQECRNSASALTSMGMRVVRVLIINRKVKAPTRPREKFSISNMDETEVASDPEAAETEAEPAAS